jgi:hypothetical protein
MKFLVFGNEMIALNTIEQIDIVGGENVGYRAQFFYTWRRRVTKCKLGKSFKTADEVIAYLRALGLEMRDCGTMGREEAERWLRN